MTTLHKALGAAVLVLLVANVAAFWVVGTRVTPVTVETAVERFRTAAESSADDGSSDGSDTRAITPVGSDKASATAATDGSDKTISEGSRERDTGAGHATSTADGAPNRLRTPGETAARSEQSGAAASGRPEPGVYVYRTGGFEEVSFGVGARHDYPAETTMTVTPNDCGVDVRWDVFEERWDRWTTCTPDDAIRLRTFVTHHEFFGQVEHRRYDCTASTLIRVAGDEPGGTAAGRCESDGAVVEVTTTVVGHETVDVGGEAVDAVRVRVDEQLDGDTRGTRTSESWYARSSGLLLRRTGTTDVDTEAVFGSTHYREELTLELTSTEPLR